jgi:hypothetical protein
MSHRNVETLLGRLATDPALRQRFAENRKAALAEFGAQGYQLTEVEIEALASIDADAIEAFATALDERLRKAAQQDNEGVRS